MKAIKHMNNKILYICNAVRWFDKVNGNTYHSVRVTRCSDGVTIVSPMQYGYGDHYRQTAIEEMHKANWLPEKYTDKTKWLYERENGYPIYWSVSEGSKRECVSNGVL